MIVDGIWNNYIWADIKLKPDRKMAEHCEKPFSELAARVAVILAVIGCHLVYTPD